MGDEPSPVERVGGWEADCGDAFAGVYVDNALVSRQGRPEEHWTGFAPEILRLVGPYGDELPEIESGCDDVFVHVERFEAPGWVPPSTTLLGVGGIERVAPRRVRDAPPFVPVWQDLGAHATPDLRVGSFEVEHRPAGQ